MQVSITPLNTLTAHFVWVAVCAEWRFPASLLMFLSLIFTHHWRSLVFFAGSGVGCSAAGVEFSSSTNRTSSPFTSNSISGNSAAATSSHLASCYPKATHYSPMSTLTTVYLYPNRFEILIRHTCPRHYTTSFTENTKNCLLVAILRRSCRRSCSSVTKQAHERCYVYSPIPG